MNVWKEVLKSAQQKGLIGREKELHLLWLAAQAGRHVLLEGPVGSGKTFLATLLCEILNRPIFRVDGDSRYSESKMVGQWDPAITLEKGYIPESFREGPLTQAMKAGGALLINELNRMPESVQNILLPALDEDRIEIPGIGSIAGAPGFFVIATQNPREYVATHSLSEALLDRFDWLEIEYPTRDEELEILRTQGPQGDLSLSGAWRRLLVDSVRETRGHKGVKRGASIRAALAWADWVVAHAQTGSPAYSEQLNLNRELYLSSGVAVLANRVEWVSAPSGKGNRTGMIRSILETFWDEWVGTDSGPIAGSLTDGAKKKP